MQNESTASASDVALEIAAFHQPAIDSARKMIFWAGMIYALLPVLIFGMFARFTGPSIFASKAFVIMFGVGVGIWGIHMALAWWVKKSPLPATTLALAVFIAYQGALMHYGYFSNMIVTLVGLFILGRGVLAGYRVHKLRAQLRST
jgi:hypothetical protein